MTTKLFVPFVESFAQFISKYLGLIKDDGNEVSGAGYVRQSVSFGLTSEDSNYYYLTNTNEVRFPKTTAPYGTVAKVGIYDSVSGGNLLILVDLVEPKYVYANDQVIFQVGAIEIKIPKEVR